MQIYTNKEDTIQKLKEILNIRFYIHLSNPKVNLIN